MLPLTTFSRETIIAADVTGEITVTRILFIVKWRKQNRKRRFVRDNYCMYLHQQNHISIFSQWNLPLLQLVSGSDAADLRNNLTQTRSFEFPILLK